MRKFLTFLIALAAIAFGVCSPATAQKTILGFPPGMFDNIAARSPASGGGGCTQATNFLARVTSASLTIDSTHTTAYTNLICGLVTDGLITGAMTGAQGSGADCNSVAGTGFFDGLYIYATNTTGGSAVTLTEMNLCGTSFTLTDGATLTAHFTADRGYVTGTNADYFETSFNPSTATSPTFKLNSAHFAVWNNTNGNDVLADIGNGNVTVFNHMYINYSTGTFYSRLNDASAASGYTISNPQSLLVGNRSASGAIQGYGPLTTSGWGSLGTGTQASGSAVNNATMQIFRQNGAASSGVFQLGAASFGGSLSSGQVTNYYSRMKTYMTAVGVCGVITCP